MSSFTSHPDLVLPPDSLLLVTGGSGFIASHIVAEALALGYRVRGTVRSQSKADTTSTYFISPHYSPCIVPDMSVPGAFANAVQGVDAVIHTASVVDFSPDPNKVITPVVQAIRGILEVAADQPSLKRFVYTSSSTAASLPIPGKKFVMDAGTWNEEDVRKAWTEPYEGAEKAWTVYAASKTEAERAVWRFVEERKSGFSVNCVLPNANFGRVLMSAGATGDWVPGVLRGVIPEGVPPQWMVNVTDNARCHLAAAFDGSLVGERIYAFDSPFNWNGIVDVVRRVRPGAKTLPDRIQGELEDLSEPDNRLGGMLLKKWWGQEGEDRRGWTGLLESVKQNLEGVEA